MGNINDEIKIIDAEIEKTEKAIWKEVENYKELKREASDHFKRYNDIPPKAEIFKEARKVLVDAMRNGGKDLEAHEHTIKNLQSRLNTLKQSREDKLNKIVFREHLEEVDKLQKEAEELKQRKAELSAKYAKPNPQDTPVSTPQDTAKQDKFIPFLTPAGAKWNDLEISFDEDNLDIVRVTVKEIKEVKNYAEMGFKNINTGLPNKPWKRLLEFRKGNIKYSGVQRKAVESDISRLRKFLKKYFRIEGNPINFKHGYEAAFKVNVMEKSNRSVHSFSNYEEEKEEND